MTGRQTKKRQRSLLGSYEKLEDRKLLAANIFYDPASMIVTVIGNSDGDRLDLTQDEASVTVAIEGGTAASYDLADVVEVRYYAGGGNDSFYNATGIVSFFAGHAGDDFFSGGSGNDRSFGGDGNDILNGNDGDDTLNGGGDNDVVNGNDGNDELHGDAGDDEVIGGEGDDYIAGEFGDDKLNGDGGNDFLIGSRGNDELSGGTGDDAVYGQADQDIVYGNDGDDRVRGNDGDDVLYGGDGNDFLMSDVGNDIAYGEAGNDQLFAFSGDDRLEGGDGDDLISGESGTNTLIGGDGVDLVIGGTGRDLIFGEAGDDQLYGLDGDDEIDGGLGVDRVVGGNGDDALYGGELVSADTLIGGGGDDRFITQPGDLVSDAGERDAVLEFINETADWTDAEITVLKDGFRQLYDITGNNVLIQETLNNDSLKFYKYATLNGAAGINYLQTSTSWYYQNGQRIYTYQYTREIRILDWDETSSFYNDQFVDVLIHELAHNWDSELELEGISADLGAQWSAFLGLSGWTDQNPNSPNDYSRSHDSQWWYLNSAQFAENYGRTNPKEDMATMIERFMHDGGADPEGTTVLDAKLNLIDSIFSEISLL